MSLRQFEYALAVAEAGSVTAAAERLHVAQPSVSQQIRGLERDLGVELFARTPSGLVPTVVGRAFLREAEVAVNALRDNELAPATAARVSQAATAVRWAAHGLGATLVPASAVPPGHEHLVRPVFPAVTQPVIAVLRSGAGPAETALLAFLRQENWPPLISH
ncbi:MULTISPECIES: LysR family transcriptional regulator [unclassified Streptomyces]|uniref:LysR family transcriptional regulator n=1 Tax=Streptomyces sp. NBC_00060 TaxID=2975636 RepID=A0AAU2HA14_9ACTN